LVFVPGCILPLEILSLHPFLSMFRFARREEKR
jgi:hypothetical protein